MKNSSKTPTFVDQNKIYHMKRTLLLIFTLLTVTLAAVAQPRISSNKETHNFGQIEWKKPVTVEYTITKEGQKINRYTPSEDQQKSGKKGKKVGIAYELDNGEIIYVPEE